MGQSASSERGEVQTGPRHEIGRLSRRIRDRRSIIASQEQPLGATISSPVGDQPHSSQGSTNAQPFATFSRQISAQSIPVRDDLGHNRDAQTQDHFIYQQQEERTLVHRDEPGMRNGPITHITASPMPRRLSTFSRLTSRAAPRHSINGSVDAVPEPQTEGQTLRRRFSERLSSRTSGDNPSSGSRPLSMLGSLARRSSLTPRSRRRRGFAPISRPFPLVLEGSSPMSDLITDSPGDGVLPDGALASDDEVPQQGQHPPTRSSRLARVRQSLSIPFESVRPLSRHFLPVRHGSHQPPERPSRAFHPGDDYLLPPLAVADTRLDMDDAVLHSQIDQHRERAPQRSTPVAAPQEQPRSGPDRSFGSGREPRRMPNMLRGRSSRLIRRQDEGPLPRILHLAAVAIAAQLSGNPDRAFTNLQAVGADGFDDSLSNLFRTLHEATDAMNSPTTAEDPSDSATSLGSLPPLNFLRVFRFVNSERDVVNQDNSLRSRGQGHAPAAVRRNSSLLDEDDSNDMDGRTVTLVVVGVRSVPSDHIGHEDVANTGPSLEALLNMPLPPTAPSNVFRGNGLRRSDGRSRLPRPRRASFGGANPFPSAYGRQRLRRFSSSPNESGILTPATVSGSVSGTSDLPTGSHPPPSTPAEYGITPYASGDSTPSRRPSSASALQQAPSNTRDVTYNLAEEPHPSTSEQTGANPVHQRRRSDSESARHRNLGAGAARRNGVVAPDGVEADGNVPSGSRSWLIYVVGTNISENHPALTTPSLFTDNPTYEDMLLLSSLLGPARPPVASREDVASAGGVYQLRKNAGSLIAAALQGNEMISVIADRCLVCLCDYELNDEVRQLTKCKHLFHRECIDQ
ncbi:MAG: hypothetical protein Q9183_001323, partial [Haloplaca sp. 2 TL-2023]